MPIYEYQCQSCEHILDALQKIDEDPLKFCPECGEPQLKRLLSAPRFRLKGKGWYETDFKSGNQRNLAKGDSAESKGKDDKKDDKKGETKKDSSDKSAKKSSGSAKD